MGGGNGARVGNVPNADSTIAILVTTIAPIAVQEWMVKMSILIKGMEMPESCWDCPIQVNPFCVLDLIELTDTEKRIRPDKCPLFEVPEWIPVKERLPDFEGCLLCMVEDGTYAGIRYQTILYFDERGFTDGFGTSEDLIVTHWMPLPEPPKEL